LGIGVDGHTSSLFPGQNYLLNSPEIYAVSVHPQTRLKRIALTGLPILHAKKVFFYVLGKNKTDVLKEVIKGNDNYPAGYIISRLDASELFTDSL
jgi:6-phosphogluconolactonase (EC 3.1.1.31)